MPQHPATAPQPGVTPQSEAQARYRGVREQSLALAAPLSAEDCQLQSMPDASPTKWHLAHTSWFFETFVLERFERDFMAFDNRFRVLFNSYYEGVGPQHPRAERGLISHPSLEEVRAYRHQVDQRVIALLEDGSDDAQLLDLIELGLNHEQQHQELILTDIKHALSRNPAWPVYAAPRATPSSASGCVLRWSTVVGGVVELGHHAPLDGTFHFDNERPRHRALLRDFALASRPVSNAEYRAFIDDGGYRRAELWLSMGWDWVRCEQRRAPLYWTDDLDSAFTLHGRSALEAAAPVCHLNYFEADAYARWAGARLPTEGEWEHAARQFDASTLDGHFADTGDFHPRPDRTDTALSQLFGGVWEWTQSAYGAYPGFRPAVGAVGEYNGKFMCNQYVLRGGSCATPAGHVRASYRNFFPPQAQWQFSGLRLARDL